VVVRSLVQTTWAVVIRPDSVAGGGAGGRRSAAVGAHGTANPRKSRGGVFSGRPMAAAVADTLRPCCCAWCMSASVRRRRCQQQQLLYLCGCACGAVEVAAAGAVINR